MRKGTKKVNDKTLTKIKDTSNQIANELDADVLLVNAPIENGLDDDIICAVDDRKRRKNIFLILVTPGGDANASYRIARCLQDSYERFIAFVSGYCKSAGTLCVLGANEIVMSDMGELGPLDVQVYKKDELFEASSGLVASEALSALQSRAFEMFEEYFLAIQVKSGNRITFKTATEIAAKISVGLLEPLYKQIDPLHVGEIARSMKIARDYGKRLMLRSHNYDDKTLDMLVETYPSHGFVIDKPEAETLFRNVRGSTETEKNLRKLLGKVAHLPKGRNQIFEFLSEEIKGEKNENENKNVKTNNSGESKARRNTSRNKKDS